MIPMFGLGSKNTDFGRSGLSFLNCPGRWTLRLKESSMFEIRALTEGNQQYDIVMRETDSGWIAYAIKVVFPPTGAGWGRDTNIWAAAPTKDEAFETICDLLRDVSVS